MRKSYQELKDTLSDLALDAERAYAIQLAIWRQGLLSRRAR